MEVAAGYDGDVLRRDPAVQVCLVEELDSVDEGCEAAPFSPEAARRVARDRVGLPTVRMRSDQRGAGLARRTQGSKIPVSSGTKARRPTATACAALFGSRSLYVSSSPGTTSML